MNCWIIIAALNPPWHTECAPCWWLMALLPTIRVGDWNGGTSEAMGCPADCGTSEKLWDLWDTQSISLFALSSAKPPKTISRGELASQGNSAWRLLDQGECCFQQCGTQAAWGTACPHSLHINAYTELFHAYIWYLIISSHLRLESKGCANLSLLGICLSFQRLIELPLECTSRCIKMPLPANAHLYVVGAAATYESWNFNKFSKCSSAARLVVAFAVTVAFVKQKG